VSSTNLLDIATQIAISAIKPKEGKKKTNEKKKEGKRPVDPTTINNLMAFLQSNKNINELLLYTMRQTGREEIDEDTGKLLLRNLRNKRYEEALKLLGYVKWIYDTLDGLNVNYDSVKNVKSFTQLVEFLSNDKVKK